MTDQQIGERLRIARALRRKTQADAAKVLGMEQSGVSDIEHGRRSMKIVDAWKLATEWELPIEVFVDPRYPLLGSVSDPVLNSSSVGAASLDRRSSGNSSRVTSSGHELRLVG